MTEINHVACKFHAVLVQEGRKEKNQNPKPKTQNPKPKLTITSDGPNGPIMSIERPQSFTIRSIPDVDDAIFGSCEE